MDVPVALALLLAWLPSVVNTLRADGEVYFDSVGMFIFFLSAGRFVEMSVRHRSLNSSEALARSLPAQVTRLLADGNRERVAAHALAAGDRFLVPKGGVVAVDARLPADLPAEVHASLDESLITGESAAVRRGAGERIRGGSVNLGSPLTLDGDRDGGRFDTGVDGAAAGARAGHAPAASRAPPIARPRGSSASSWCWR